MNNVFALVSDFNHSADCVKKETRHFPMFEII